MAKIAMACPFSNKMCRDCAVFRGSHYYLCFKKEYRGCLIEEQGKSTKKTSYGLDDFAFGVPDDLLVESRMIKDVEDIIEAEEFGKYKERREA